MMPGHVRAVAVVVVRRRVAVHEVDERRDALPVQRREPCSTVPS